MIEQEEDIEQKLEVALNKARALLETLDRSKVRAYELEEHIARIKTLTQLAASRTEE